MKHRLKGWFQNKFPHERYRENKFFHQAECSDESTPLPFVYHCARYSDAEAVLWQRAGARLQLQVLPLYAGTKMRCLPSEDFREIFGKFQRVRFVDKAHPIQVQATGILREYLLQILFLIVLYRYLQYVR